MNDDVNTKDDKEHVEYVYPKQKNMRVYRFIQNMVTHLQVVRDFAIIGLKEEAVICNPQTQYAFEEINENTKNSLLLCMEAMMEYKTEKPTIPDYKVCAFTGHRPKYFSFKNDVTADEYLYLREKLAERISNAINEGCNYFIVGGAEGVDTWAAEIVIDKKTLYQNIKLEIAIPCKEQADKMVKTDSMSFAYIIQNADFVNILSPKYFDGVFNLRNKYMVDKASKLIAVYNGNPSGTRNTILYAQSKSHIEVDIIGVK